jgi:hypothetical protein
MAAAKKATAKKSTAKKSTAKKSTAKKSTAKKSTAKKATGAAKKATGAAKKATGAAKKATRTAKKATKKAVAAATGGNVVVASKVKEAIRGQDVRMSSEFVDALNEHVNEVIARATERAKGNGRSTVRPGDL